MKFRRAIKTQFHKNEGMNLHSLLISRKFPQPQRKNFLGKLLGILTFIITYIEISNNTTKEILGQQGGTTPHNLPVAKISTFRYFYNSYEFLFKIIEL